MAGSNDEWGELARHDDQAAEAWDGFSRLPEPGQNIVLDALVASKHLTHESLVRLGARLADDQVLAFAFPGGIKFRDLLTGRRWSFPGSEFRELKIVPHSTEPTAAVIVAEGETDGAWLSDHAGCDVAILPAGADPRPHAASFARQLSSYEIVLLGQDNDKAGDEGARILADLLPQAVRYAPPENNDWCSYNGALPPVPEAPHNRILVSVGEIATLEPPPMISWFERGLLPVAGQLILHGWAKSFKSFLALDLCAALAQGIPWANFEPTEEPCRVVVMQYEIPWAYLQQRVSALRSTAPELDLLDRNMFVWTPMQRPQFVAGDTDSENAILRVLTDNDVQIFLLDPVRRATGNADMNSEKEVRPLLHFFQRLQDEGITVLTTHHDNKTYARSGGGDPLGMTGAGAFAGDADTIVSVSIPRGETIDSTRRNLHFTTRNAPSIGARGMTMTESGVIVYQSGPHGHDDSDDAVPPSSDDPAI